MKGLDSISKGLRSSKSSGFFLPFMHSAGLRGRTVLEVQGISECQGLPKGSYSLAGRLIFKQMIPQENARVHCGKCYEGGVNPHRGDQQV